MSETPSPPPPRRPGGQPGNGNALKHGFYRRKPKQMDQAAVANAGSIDLAEEIHTLRLSIRSVVESYESGESSLDLLSFGRYLCLALTGLDRLIRAQHFLSANQDDFLDTFNNLMDDFVSESSFEPQEKSP